MAKPTPSTQIAYTVQINPPGATPILTINQVWKALEIKVQHAEWFVAGALKSTDVLSVKQNEQGHRVTTREVVFVEGGGRIREVCTEYPMMKVEYTQPCGGMVCNILSRGDGGEEDLFMTYTFQYYHPDATEEEIQALTEKRKQMAKNSVAGSVKVMREMVSDGRIN